MVITIVTKDEIINTGQKALGKVKNSRSDVLDNITVTLAMIISAGLDKGYKIELPFHEFGDLGALLIKAVKAESCIAVISIPPDPPIHVLNGVRGLTDNAIHTITHIDKTLMRKAIIELVGIKPDRRAEYAIDYATTLL